MPWEDSHPDLSNSKLDSFYCVLLCSPGSPQTYRLSALLFTGGHNDLIHLYKNNWGVYLVPHTLPCTGWIKSHSPWLIIICEVYNQQKWIECMTKGTLILLNKPWILFNKPWIWSMGNNISLNERLSRKDDVLLVWLSRLMSWHLSCSFHALEFVVLCPCHEWLLYRLRVLVFVILVYSTAIPSF